MYFLIIVATNLFFLPPQPLCHLNVVLVYTTYNLGSKNNDKKWCYIILL